MTDLLPCPGCGAARPNLDIIGDGWQVWCWDCLFTCTDENCRGPDGVIKAWNTRAILPALLVVREAFASTNASPAFYDATVDAVFKCSNSLDVTNAEIMQCFVSMLDAAIEEAKAALPKPGGGQ